MDLRHHLEEISIAPIIRITATHLADKRHLGHRTEYRLL
jgi:hypothetical protein